MGTYARGLIYTGSWTRPSRTEVARFTSPPPGRPAKSLAQMRTMLDRRIARSEEGSDYGMWAVELRATSQVVGAVLLRPIRRESNRFEIGWHFNPDDLGAGYATEAGRGVIGLALGSDAAGTRPGGAGPASRRNS